MRTALAKCFFYSFLVLVALFVTGCSGLSQPEQPVTKNTPSAAIMPTPLATQQPVEQPAAGQLSPTIDALAQQVLVNIHQHGWNPAAQYHGAVTGGLYINWKMDDPSQTNALKLGMNDVTAGNHDPQVDLYYLNALAEYRSLHPADHSYDTDMEKILPLVQHEFANYNLPKGWIYFFLLRDGLLLNNTGLIDEAHTAAKNYYTTWYDPNVGTVYNHKANPPNFNVEHTINCGTALIDAGKRWNEPDWVQAGESTINHTLDAALNPQYHLLYNNVIVTPGNTLRVQDYQAKPSTQGNTVIALVTAYNLTHEQHYLDVAGQILHSMFASPLWDQARGGLFFALDMDSGKLQQSYKETRGQTLSLVGLYHYNQALRQLGQPPQLLDKQQQLIDVLSKKFYQSTYHGFFYRVTPAFAVYTSSPGQGIGVEDFFTTEAMGTALDALQQSEFANLAF